MNAGVCQECGDKLLGRVDKKFCNDQCRNTYNNRQRRAPSQAVRKVNKILLENRAILEKLVPDNTANVHRDKLLKEGFDFNYFTNTLTTREGKKYYFCYDYGYLQSDGDWLLLVKRLEEF
jgi:hypothetical protein